MLRQPAVRSLAQLTRSAERRSRPKLGEVMHEGSTANNLLARGIKGATGVFIDDNPACPPSERFKAIGGDMAYYDPDTLLP